MNNGADRKARTENRTAKAGFPKRRTGTWTTGRTDDPQGDHSHGCVVSGRRQESAAGAFMLMYSATAGMESRTRMLLALQSALVEGATAEQGIVVCAAHAEGVDVAGIGPGNAIVAKGNQAEILRQRTEKGRKVERPLRAEEIEWIRRPEPLRAGEQIVLGNGGAAALEKEEWSWVLQLASENPDALEEMVALEVREKRGGNEVEVALMRVEARQTAVAPPQA